jgi:hypothetical protein
VAAIIELLPTLPCPLSPPQSFGVPTLVLGGGGYTIRNVARCWANETAVVLGETLPDYIPPNDYIEFYRPDYRLHLEPACEWCMLWGPEGLCARDGTGIERVPPFLQRWRT